MRIASISFCLILVAFNVKASPPVLYRNAQEEVVDDKFCIPIVNICILKTPKLAQEVEVGGECFNIPIVNICILKTPTQVQEVIVGDDKFCIPIVNICILRTPTQEVQDEFPAGQSNAVQEVDVGGDCFNIPIVNICILKTPTQVQEVIVGEDKFCIPIVNICFLKTPPQEVQDEIPAIQEDCHFKLPIVNICVIPALEEDDLGRKCLQIGEGEACISDDVSDLSVTDGQGDQGCFMKLGHLCISMPTVMDEFPAVEEEKECKIKILGVCIQWSFQEELDEEYHLTINGHGVWPKGPADQEECHFKIPIVGICVIPALQDLFSAVQDQDPAVQEDCKWFLSLLNRCMIPALKDDEQGRKCLKVGTGLVCVSDDVSDLSLSDDYSDNYISDTYNDQDELGCFIEFGQLCVEMPTVMDEFTAVEEKNDFKLDAFGIGFNWSIREDMDDECNLRINDYCAWTKDPVVQENCFNIPIVNICI